GHLPRARAPGPPLPRVRDARPAREAPGGDLLHQPGLTSRMRLTLPDGSPLDLPDGATGHDAAAAIGPGLARAALAVKVGDEVRDLARPLADLEEGATIEIVTARSGDPYLYVLRHSAAHALAEAVTTLIPGAKLG